MIFSFSFSISTTIIHLALLPLPGQIRALLNTDGWGWATFYGRRETDAPEKGFELMRKELICKVDNAKDTMTKT